MLYLLICRTGLLSLSEGARCKLNFGLGKFYFRQVIGMMPNVSFFPLPSAKAHFALQFFTARLQSIDDLDKKGTCPGSSAITFY